LVKSLSPPEASGLSKGGEFKSASMLHVIFLILHLLVALLFPLFLEGARGRLFFFVARGPETPRNFGAG
jgi:hypothetical protein